MTERNAVESVDEMPVCRACGLMTGEYVHPNNPVCIQCFNRLNWAAHQGMWVYITPNGEKYHETPLCPAIRGEWQMTRHEVIYLDLSACKWCDGHRWGFDNRRGEQLAQV